jgi:hypothetical protein
MAQFLARLKNSGCLSTLPPGFSVAQKKNYKDDKKASYTASPLRMGRQIGTHQKWCREEVAEAIAQLPFNKRDTMASISSALQIPTTTIHRMYRQDGIIRRQKNTIKPTLTEPNKFFRVLYCFNQIQGVRNDELYFKANHFSVHVDEKWFFITQQQQSTYLVPGEAPPQRNVRATSCTLRK